MSHQNSEETRRERDRPPNGGRTLIANRDKPLFGTMHRRQHSPQFFTESLNTTFNPSPSPMRQGTNTKPKQKQALRNGRGLEAAFRAIQTRREENKPAPLAASSTRQHSQPHSPQRSSPRLPTRTISSPADRSSAGPPGMRTPSPSRGRQPQPLVSPTSDASASSPPRGLAEAYQRITDEEDLAAQEGGSDDEVDDSGELQPQQDISNGQLHRRREASESPLSRASSRRKSWISPSGQSLPSDAAFLESTQDSTTSSPFEEIAREDQDLDNSLFQRTRDQQRLNGVLGNSAQPFKKARRSGRHSSVMDSLRRDDGSSHSGSSSFGSHTTSSVLSDPSLNIPQGWGRKGRHRRTWMDGIRHDGSAGADAGRLRYSPADQAPCDDRKISAIIDWQEAAASTPLPVVDSDSLQPGFSRHSTPQPQTAQTSTADRQYRTEANEGDRNYLLRLPDDPPIRIRSAAIDAIRDREIQSLEKSAVTTNRLGELKEKRSLERVGRRPASNPVDAAGEDKGHVNSSSKEGREDLKSISNHRAREHKIPFVQEEALLEDISGTPVPNSPVLVFRRQSPVAECDSNSSASSGHSNKGKGDTRDVLRKLARVTSASPSPEPETASSSAKDVKEANIGQRDIGNSHEEKEIRRLVGTINDDHNDEKRQQAQSDQEVKQEPKQEPKPELGIGSTPQQQVSTVLKTPLVTGAWIETPIPTNNRYSQPRKTHERILEERIELVDAALTKMDAKNLAKDHQLVTKPAEANLRLEDTAPELPRSALAAILEQAKSKRSLPHPSKDSNDDTLQLDDSTIESLEGLLASSDGDIAPSSPPSPSEPQSQTQNPTTKTPPESSSAATYSHLTNRLTRLKSSISDAKEGLGSLQRRLQSPNKPPAGASASSSSASLVRPLTKQRRRRRGKSAPSATGTTTTSECDEAGEMHDFVLPCEKCARREAQRRKRNQRDQIGWAADEDEDEDGYYGDGDVDLYYDDYDGAKGGWDWRLRPIMLPMPKLWTKRRKGGWPRLTRKGWWVAVLVGLVVAEKIAR